MNAPNLSRRLATRIIEGLQGRGRIVVVRGGTSAVVRAVDDAIACSVAELVDCFERETSAAMLPSTRDKLTLLASRVAATLLASEHLEDVFADRLMVEREIFDSAGQILNDASADERARVMHIEVDMLGYVASTVAKFATEEVLLQSLECAAESLLVKLIHYDAQTREADFAYGDDVCPDLRLELEEAVAEELVALVDQGVVELPAFERTRPLLHHAGSAQRTRIMRLIDRAAAQTLKRTGCSARWEFPEDRFVRVSYTPLSEQDVRDVDTHVADFATAVDSILAHAGAPFVTHVPPEIDALLLSVGQDKMDGSRVDRSELPPESERRLSEVPKRARRSGTRAKREVDGTPKRAASKRIGKGSEACPAEKSAPRKKSSPKRAVAKKARSIKKSG